ncbi:MAG: I78 family peptidase inhibitor [Pseudomonadota bacterium]
MPLTLIAPALMGLLLAGCTGTGTAPAPDRAPPPPRIEAEDACGAERVQEYLGRQYSEALEASIRTESEAAAMRVIRPGEAVTLDFRADRLNVRLDDEDRISEIDCG